MPHKLEVLVSIVKYVLFAFTFFINHDRQSPINLEQDLEDNIVQAEGAETIAFRTPFILKVCL